MKSDLVRRIKMLEYALKQERYKNFTTKYPHESVPDTAPGTSQKKKDEISSQDRARLRKLVETLI